jgi:hypothetical protein
MLFDWKTWLGLIFTLTPIVLRFLPFTGPIIAGMLQTKVGRAFVVILLVVGALFFGAAWFEDRGFDRGVKKEQDRIEQQDKKAEAAADAAALTVEECYDRGFEWDQQAGKCRGKQ